MWSSRPLVTLSRANKREIKTRRKLITCHVPSLLPLIRPLPPSCALTSYSTPQPSYHRVPYLKNQSVTTTTRTQRYFWPCRYPLSPALPFPHLARISPQHLKSTHSPEQATIHSSPLLQPRNHLKSHQHIPSPSSPQKLEGRELNVPLTKGDLTKALYAPSHSTLFHPSSSSLPIFV